MDKNNPLKVALINHSDTLGGASVVTNRLMRALREKGVDAQMVVNTKTTESEYIHKFSSRFVRGARFMYEAAAGVFANGFDRKHLFEISTASSGYDLSRHPIVQQADVICLNWVNQGMLSLKGLAKLTALGKPIVWTMHDMWPMTGVCHHAHDCEGFRSGCGYCPLLRRGLRTHDKSAKVNWRKNKIYHQSNITFVAVSNWLARQGRQSSLLSNQHIEVIPNAFPVDFYLPHPLHKVDVLGIDYSKRLIIMGAARLDDPVKGLDHAIDALNLIFDTRPDIANSTNLLLFGDIRVPSKLNRLRFSYQHIGRINDNRILRHLYASSNVVLSASTVETLPGTLIEGQASGAIPVSFDNGGQSDIIDHKKSGYLAPVGDTAELAKGIIWALENPIDRDFLHSEVERKFSASLIADQYIDLFHRLLDEKAADES